MSFKTLGLRAELVKAVEALGFQTPMPIQEKAIPVLLSGEKDFVGLAQTGTGKTGAYGLPLIQQIDLTLSRPQGIVICPTRELCLQITDDLKNFSKYLKGIHILAVYGGASISDQIRQIKNRPQIIVATPGRLLDLINRKVVNLSEILYAILDEADEMLNMGFQEDIDLILEKMPKHKKVWLFSATMPKGVAAIARNYLNNPVEVTVGSLNCSPKNIVHNCYVLHEKHRYQGLKRIIDFTPEIFGLVFCRTRKETQTIAEALMQDGYQAEAIHGDLSQAQRDYVMQRFRQKTIQILVATDVAARGLDVDDITHVIHYNLPDETEAYTHRSGRTARAGKSGVSIALINTKQMRRIRELEKRGKIQFEFCKIPDGRAICEKQLFGLVDKIVHTDVNRKEIADYLPAVYDALDNFDKDELIKRFVSAEFNRFIEYYRHTDDINVNIGSKKAAVSKTVKTAKRKDRLKEKKTQRFLINVGRLDKINEGAIVRFVCDNSGIRSSMIGEIDLDSEFSFFEVEKSVAGRVRDSFNNARLDGRPVQIRRVLEKKNQRKRKRSAPSAQ
ncbi:MAG: DEAD/DEAH box helicase [Desulfobacterales bacterium]|nr:DEAD/DEAH box helicase [Desulfobacterales bacterium]